MHPEAPIPEIPLPVRPRRIRVQRTLCLVLLSFLAVPLFLVGGGPLSPVDAEASMAVRSVEGRPPPRATTVAPDQAMAGLSAVRRSGPTTTAPPATTTTTVPASSTTAATTTSAVPPTTTTPPATTTPPTTAAPTTAAPTTVAPTTAPPAPPTTAAPTTTTAPPATTTTTTAPPATTTTTAPGPVGHSQRGQATWYRWKPGNCAHNTLPKGTVVTVTAVASGRSTFCVVGDRGAFRSPTIIDLDATVFAQIAPLGAGRIEVSISW